MSNTQEGFNSKDVHCLFLKGHSLNSAKACVEQTRNPRASKKERAAGYKLCKQLRIPERHFGDFYTCHCILCDPPITSEEGERCLSCRDPLDYDEKEECDGTKALENDEKEEGDGTKSYCDWCASEIEKNEGKTCGTCGDFVEQRTDGSWWCLRTIVEVFDEIGDSDEEDDEDDDDDDEDETDKVKEAQEDEKADGKDVKESPSTSPKANPVKTASLSKKEEELVRSNAQAAAAPVATRKPAPRKKPIPKPSEPSIWDGLTLSQVLAKLKTTCKTPEEIEEMFILYCQGQKPKIPHRDMVEALQIHRGVWRPARFR